MISRMSENYACKSWSNVFSGDSIFAALQPIPLAILCVLDEFESFPFYFDNLICEYMYIHNQLVQLL